MLREMLVEIVPLSLFLMKEPNRLCGPLRSFQIPTMNLSVAR